MGEESHGVATAVLIRHADVTPEPGGDPALNAAGVVRAQALRRVLADAGIGAIYVTRFRRSRQTAEPLAADLGIVPVVVDDDAGVAAAICALPASSVALVVGHSNTVPEIIAGLGGPTLPLIGEAEFDRLFVLVGGRLVRLRYAA